MSTTANTADTAFQAYPTRRVVAIIDAPEDVVVARSELERAGFTEEAVEVLSGSGGETRLDATGERHGIAARLIRFVQGYGDMERNTLQRQADELRAGHSLIGVYVRNETERDAAERVLRRCRGHFIIFFGYWTIVGMDP